MRALSILLIAALTGCATSERPAQATDAAQALIQGAGGAVVARMGAAASAPTRGKQ